MRTAPSPTAPDSLGSNTLFNLLQSHWFEGKHQLRAGSKAEVRLRWQGHGGSQSHHHATPQAGPANTHRANLEQEGRQPHRGSKFTGTDTDPGEAR